MAAAICVTGCIVDDPVKVQAGLDEGKSDTDSNCQVVIATDNIYVHPSQVVLDGDSLEEGFASRIYQSFLQLRQTDEDDIDEFFFGRLRIGQEPDRFQEFEGHSLRFIDDQKESLPALLQLPQVLTELDQECSLGLVRRCLAEG